MAEFESNGRLVLTAEALIATGVKLAGTDHVIDA
jgi:hypothetical protein